jgi:hypothetical protein
LIKDVIFRSLSYPAASFGGVPSDPSSLAAVLAAASGDTPSWMQAWGSVIAAGAAVLTLGVAGAAAAVAWGQLSESRRLRREQAQAYVVIYA